MKQTYSLTTYSEFSTFFRNKDSNWAICKEFVQKVFGIRSVSIRVMVSSTRPHEAGWKVVHLISKSGVGKKYVTVGRTKAEFAILPEHLRMFGLAGTHTGWIKVVKA